MHAEEFLGIPVRQTWCHVLIRPGFGGRSILTAYLQRRWNKNPNKSLGRFERLNCRTGEADNNQVLTC
jgi:hypothetical protein